MRLKDHMPRMDMHKSGSYFTCTTQKRASVTPGQHGNACQKHFVLHLGNTETDTSVTPCTSLGQHGSMCQLHLVLYLGNAETCVNYTLYFTWATRKHVSITPYTSPEQHRNRCQLHLVLYLGNTETGVSYTCLLYTSPSPRDDNRSRMPSSA